MSDTSSLLSHMSAEQPHSPSQSLNLGAFNTYGNALVTHTAW
jgi:hypothetical protein